jgi:ATP-dependent helicase/nuclease subunit B
MIDSPEQPGRTVLASEYSGAMQFHGAKVIGRADRIDRMADGTLAIVDYKTGTPPSKPQVKAGYALQLGILGLIAQHGKFERDGNVVTGSPTRFEYWSLGKEQKSDTFGYWQTPMKEGSARSGLPPEEYLPFHSEKLSLAIRDYIQGRKPFTARENPDYKGYNEYDQLMRLDEWLTSLTDKEDRA